MDKGTDSGRSTQGHVLTEDLVMITSPAAAVPAGSNPNLRCAKHFRLRDLAAVNSGTTRPHWAWLEAAFSKTADEVVNECRWFFSFSQGCWIAEKGRSVMGSQHHSF